MSYMEVRGLKKTFDGKNYVLKDINLDIEKGSLVTLLGPSGCGKSTLLRSIAGFITPEEGTITVNGVDIMPLPPKNRQLGMVFQQYSLFPTMSVQENIAFGLEMKKLPKNQIEGKTKEIIELVGLTGREKAHPHELSGGQKQRVALARALVTEPKLLLLDEPLSAIDAKLRKNLQRTIRRIQQTLKITTIFVTHDQDEAMILSDKILLMNKGRIEQEGTPVELYTGPKTGFAASFIGNYNIFTPREAELLTGKEYKGSVALRPETVALHKKNAAKEGADDLYLPGRIKDITPRGNILSYEVEVFGIPVKADILFRSKFLFSPGEEVMISFESRNCLNLTDDEYQSA